MPAKSKVLIRDVSRSFVSPAGELIQAIHDINLDIEDKFAPDGRDIGEFSVLLGPSGCGKSTILRLIAGLDRPDTGQILVNGAAVTAPGRDRGMVFQKYTSFPWLTVNQNVEYGLKINGFPEAERRQTVQRLIEAVGLSGFEKSYPDTLSGGMQQRVAIARTLALRPSVILMDEPFGALDAQTREDMQELLLKIWGETASTVLFVTHDVDEAVYLADHIYILCARPGTIMEDVPVPFGRPRDRSIKQTEPFHQLQQHVLACLRRAPGQGQVRVSV
ncbi:MAG TPA: ABC transporter ATP-binding protein [Bryobacteraceae bacterium]|jgi:ABC-type nitrate/sulfonate/bicarbonate transport system ATPase subunit|nr:ABC transporter ATP-binding protein [Bryobacteraceae bacterium]